MPIGPKDWSPLPPPGSDDEIIKKALKEIAPQISVGVRRDEDTNFIWDGDGPDPSEFGFIPYNIDVYAMSIVNGEEVEGHGYLGGSYDKPGEFDPDIGGYFPQKLEEAFEELSEQLSGEILKQAKAALQYLKKYMRMTHERDKNIKNRYRPEE